MKKLSFFALFYLFFAYGTFIEAINFTLRDIGTIATEKSLVGTINNQGIVTGQIKEREGVKQFIWHQDTGLVNLNLESTNRLPFINNNNQLAGTYWYLTDYWIYRNEGFKHIYLMNLDFILQDLNVPQGWKKQSLEKWQITQPIWDDQELAVIGFNDLGQILVANSCHEKKRTRFCLWQEGKFNPIDPEALDKVYAINNDGILLGRQWVLNEGNNVPMLVLYDPSNGSMASIMKDVELISYDLNDLYQVIGVRKHSSSPNKSEGFLWDIENGLTLLDNFIPSAINNKGQIVGYQVSNDENLIPTLMDSGVMVDLNKQMDFENSETAWVRINTVKDINDEGCIIGEGTFDDKTHGFILIPIENSFDDEIDFNNDLSHV